MPESYGFLSTYPPTQCGLATFTASLASALEAAGRAEGAATEYGVVRVVDGDEARRSAAVVHHLVNTASGGELAAAEALDRFDVAIIQHEYGIYGGPDGETVIGIMRRLRVPAIVVLHTVLASPTVHQRQVLQQVARLASAVVVMTDAARTRLLDRYSVDPTKVVLIAHGAPTDWEAIEPRRAGGSPLILTWGLLGPGKGIEWALTALAGLKDLDPLPHYVVAGETHPHVVDRDGESYRSGLQAQADDLGIAPLVRFDNRYLDRHGLRELIRAADVVVLPYDSTDQVTSGVLIEAVTAGRPVVATAFPHAVDLLASGAGLVVPHRDPAAISAALRHILTEPGVASAMGTVGARLGAGLTWAAVAERYRALAGALLRDAVAVGA